MKKIFILLGILLVMVIPIVIASTDPEECAKETNGCGRTDGGNLLIIDIDVKVDDQTSRNLDYGEDIRTAYPDSEIIFEVKVLNNHSKDEMGGVYMNIEIEDLFEDEDSGETNEENIDDGYDYTFKLTFDLPSDTEEGDYDVIITGLLVVYNSILGELAYLKVVFISLDYKMPCHRRNWHFLRVPPLS